jgi:hypothetical protein
VPTDAVRYADQRGVLVVAAAGNQPGAAAAYPEGSPIILVGAVDRDDRSTRFSSVDRRDGFVAPGVEILSTWCRRTRGGCDVASAPYGMAEGTSFAAPHVSGVAALLVSAGHDAAQIRERLAAGAVDLGEPGPDREHGIGRVDAAASLGAAPTAATRSAPEPTTAATPAPPAPGPPPAREPRPEPEPAPEPPSEPVEETGDPAVDGSLVVEVPTADPVPVEVRLDDEAPEPTVPAADDGAHLVGLDAGAPPDGGGAADLWLRLIAVASVAITMVVWSSVARAEA